MARYLYVLSFDLGAVLEGHPDVVLSVNGDVVHHRQSSRAIEEYFFSLDLFDLYGIVLCL